MTKSLEQWEQHRRRRKHEAEQAPARHRAARERQRFDFHAEAALRGLRIEPFGTNGAVRVHGLGVDVLAGPGVAFGPADLIPMLPRR